MEKCGERVMPDLSIVIMQQCSNTLRHTQIGGYDQTVAYSERDVNHCTCKGFKFRKTCKHVNEAIESLCNYHEQVDGEPELDGICPKCLEPTEYVRVGV
jgi:hypothetical protein